MDAGSRLPGGKTFLDVLVGIQAGVLGGIVMLLWFALMSPVLGQPWWLVPNLLASSPGLNGHALAGPGLATVLGASVLLFSAGVVGALNGLTTPGGRLFGLAVSGGWYLLSYLFLWKRLAPLMVTHAPQPLLAAAFFLYGSAIGWHPQLLARARCRH